MLPRTLLISAWLLWLPASQAAWPGDGDERLAADVKVLQAAGVPSDGPGLLEYFRKQTPSHDQCLHMKELIQQLSSKKYKVREQATTQLLALGHAAFGPL